MLFFLFFVSFAFLFLSFHLYKKTRQSFHFLLFFSFLFFYQILLFSFYFPSFRVFFYPSLRFFTGWASWKLVTSAKKNVLKVKITGVPPWLVENSSLILSIERFKLMDEKRPSIVFALKKADTFNEIPTFLSLSFLFQPKVIFRNSNNSKPKPSKSKLKRHFHTRFHAPPTSASRWNNIQSPKRTSNLMSRTETPPQRMDQDRDLDRNRNARHRRLVVLRSRYIGIPNWLPKRLSHLPLKDRVLMHISLILLRFLNLPPRSMSWVSFCHFF